jgi:hypothetical protein
MNRLLEPGPKVKPRAKPRRVNLLEGEDFRCALYGSLGFSTHFIMRHTNFTPSQVAYRLRVGSVRRTAYRNGQSIVAGTLLQHTKTIAIPAVKRHLKEVMRKGKR